MNEIKVTRSRRKTISLQVNPDLTIEVRAPLRMAKRDIDKFITSHEKWIKDKLAIMKERKTIAENSPKYTSEEIEALADKAVEIIPKKVKHYAEKIGVTYGSITIRCQKTRWGSCSAKGNLNFNCLLMLMPDEVIDYVVVHELCHRKELNHSQKFWNEVEKILPDYKIRENILKSEGKKIILMR